MAVSGSLLPVFNRVSMTAIDRNLTDSDVESIIKRAMKSCLHERPVAISSVDPCSHGRRPHDSVVFFSYRRVSLGRFRGRNRQKKKQQQKDKPTTTKKQLTPRRRGWGVTSVRLNKINKMKKGSS